MAVGKFLIFDNDIGFDGMTAVRIADLVKEADDVEVEIAESRNGYFPDSMVGFDGVILTGSSASAYYSDDWISTLKQKIKEVGDAGMPILGICFGAHIIALSYNAQVKSSGSLEVGWKDITVNNTNRLFQGMPTCIGQYEVHRDIVNGDYSNLELLAWNDFSVQGFQVRGKRIYGLQFHPEVSYPMGKHILETHESQLETFGISIDDCLRSYNQASDYGAQIFRHFVALALEK